MYRINHDFLEKQIKHYEKYGKKCPQCESTNTYVDKASGIHWCGDCDCEW